MEVGSSSSGSGGHGNTKYNSRGRILGAGTVITSLLVLLCSLASMDLWRQYAINNSDYWYLQYTMGVRSGVDYWKLGFRLEDLEQKLGYQKNRIAEVKHAIQALDATPSLRLSSSSSSSSTGKGKHEELPRTRKARLMVHRLLNNETKIGQIRCGDGLCDHVCD